MAGVCDVGGCSRPARARGWCVRHYQRWRRWGDPTASGPRFSPKACNVEGCERRHHARGLCQMHWRRRRDHGTPQEDRPLRSTVNAAKWCTGCDRLLPQSAFARSASRSDGLNGHCRGCLAAWRRANRAKRRASDVKRRAALHAAEGSCSPEQLAARWAYYGGRCWRCGVEAVATDHVKPLSRGGSNWPANLRPICTPCNSSKRDTWPLAA